jgi:probable phosphomutase (TIGR03848 family)
MTLFLLVRHGETNVLGRRLTGRAPGVHLNARGQIQAEQLVERLQEIPIQALCASPLERAQETAQPLAREYGLEIDIIPEIQEVDYGSWQGRSVAELTSDAYWVEYNRYRSLYRIPGGESLPEVQLRMVQGMERLHRMHPDGVIVMVSHSDPIKALISYLLGIPLDFIGRLEVDPASVSAVEIGDYAPKVLFFNQVGKVALGEK